MPCGSPKTEFLLCTSQLGFRPQSPKTVTLVPPDAGAALPETIPFFLQRFPSRRMRDAAPPPQWAGRVHRWPFDPLAGKYTDAVENFRGKQPVHQGVLRRIESRWGTFWQGDFTEFTQPGIFQIETEQQITVPFAIGPAPYGRLLRGYLTSARCARPTTPGASMPSCEWRPWLPRFCPALRGPTA